jgi:hypothetical protein
MAKKKDGWQCVVHLYDKHVLKKVRDYQEIRKRAHKYLKENGKTEGEISKIARKVFNDIKNSTKLIKDSGCPLDLLAYPIFLKSGNLKQTKAIPLDAYLENLVKKRDLKKSRQILDSYFELTVELWKYGLHEKTYKVNQNYGVLENKVVLIDLFELTDNLESIKKSFRKKRWEEKEFIEWAIPKELIPYFKREARQTFNVKTLKKFWKTKSV